MMPAWVLLVWGMGCVGVGVEMGGLGWCKQEIGIPGGFLIPVLRREVTGPGDGNGGGLLMRCLLVSPVADWGGRWIPNVGIGSASQQGAFSIAMRQ